MVVILVLLTFFMAVLVRGIVINLAKKRETLRAELQGSPSSLSPVAPVPFPVRAIRFAEDLYYHRGHAWVKLEEGTVVKAGFDDFTQQVMGTIESIEVPSIGSQLNQGDVAWKLRHGDRTLSQLAPVGGTVVAVNEKMIKDRSLANTSLYENGWIMKIKTKAFGEEIPLLMDSFQFRVHFDRLLAKLRSSFNHPSLGMVYGDGGEVVKGVGGILDEKFWRVMVKELFHTSPE